MPIGIACLAFVLATSGPARAAIIEVPTDYPTIQQAVDHAAPGDEIVVLAGTYAENVSLVSMTSLLIRSQGGASTTIVDGGLQGSVFAVQSSTQIAIEGLTIRHGTLGVEISDSSGIRVRHNVIEGNIGAGDGGGIAVVGSNASIESNEILNNSANVNAALDGGGIFFHGTSGVVTGNRIQGNLAHEGGGIIINQPTVDLVVAGNLFIANRATYYGGGIYVNVGTHPEIRSNTIAGNSASVAGGGVWYTQASAPAISRNIIAGNSAPTGGGVHAFLPGTSPTFACNDAWNNPGGNYTGYQLDPTVTNGNIAADPRFCDAAGGDYRLDESSPCAPDHSPPGCELIGALDIGCGTTAVEPATWGAIKSHYGRAPAAVARRR